MTPTPIIARLEQATKEVPQSYTIKAEMLKTGFLLPP